MDLRKHSENSRTLWLAALIGCIMALALLARVRTPYPVVFPEEGTTRLLGVDAYLLLRYSIYSADHFPDLQRNDAATHYPQYRRNDAAGLFNLTVAGVSWVLGRGHPTASEVAQVSAWLPPFLGVLAFIPLFLLGTIHAGRAGGLLACLLFLFYPGQSMPRTLLGFADYHAAEILLAPLVVWGAVRCLQRAQTHQAPWWKPAFLHALPFLLLFLTWKGAPLFLILLGGAFWVLVTIEIALDRPAYPTAVGCFRYGTALLLLFGFVRLFLPDYLPVISTGITVQVVLGLFLIMLGPGLYHYAARLLKRWVKHPGLTALVCAGLVVLGAVLFLAYAPKGQWIVRRLLSPRPSGIREHQAVTEAGYWFILGGVGRLALLALPFGIVAAIRNRQYRFALVPITVGSLLILVWWRTNDLEYHAPLFIALLAGYVLLWALRWLNQWARSTALPRWVRLRDVQSLVPLVIGLLLVVPLWPLRTAHIPWMRVDEVRQLVAYEAGWFEAMDWMRTATPRPSRLPLAPLAKQDTDHPHPADTYGVMTAWDYGNLIALAGERYPVASRWPSQQSASWLVAESEEASLAWLCPACTPNEQVRYAVIDDRMAGPYFLTKAVKAGRQVGAYTGSRQVITPEGQPAVVSTYGPAYNRSMAARLYRHDGQGLRHYRLVYESPSQAYLGYESTNGRIALKSYFLRNQAEKDRSATISETPIISTPMGLLYDGVTTAAVKVFEVVPGVFLQGKTTPGAAIRAGATLYNAKTGHTWAYAQTTKADASGIYTLVLPYPTEPSTGTDVQLKGLFELSQRIPPDTAFTRIAPFAIPEAAVRAGDTLSVAALIRQP